MLHFLYLETGISWLSMYQYDDIVGHALQTEQLLMDIEHENVAHAYLFTGPRHLGKMRIAKWFASLLLTQELEEEKLEESRKSIERLLHPDLLVLDQLWIEGICDDWETISRTSNVSQIHRSKKPAAKTDIISIDDIRVMQERLHETSTGLWRCCIIRSVERMQPAAANAFLKILEEPPPRLVFILTTQAPSLLLPTMISRARIMRFRSLPNGELYKLLKGVSEDDSEFILHLAQGAPGIVALLRDDPDRLREQRLVQTAARSFWKSRSNRERLQLLNPLSQRGEKSEEFLLHLALALREQSPSLPLPSVQALGELSRDLQTNAHRGLLVQRFVSSV